MTDSNPSEIPNSSPDPWALLEQASEWLMRCHEAMTIGPAIKDVAALGAVAFETCVALDARCASHAAAPKAEAPSDERAAFEAWVQRELNYGYSLTPGTDQDYEHDPTDNMWLAWQARAALSTPAQPAQAPQPLSEAQIRRIHNNDACLPDLVGLTRDQWPEIVRFARAVERAHGITATPVLDAMEAATQPPQTLTDEQIESAFKRCGGKWDGDRWVIEDADLHPFVRTVIAAAPPAPPVVEPAEGNLPSRVWLNDMGTTQKLSFEPMAGASEHFEYVPAGAPAPKPLDSGTGDQS